MNAAQTAAADQERARERNEMIAAARFGFFVVLVGVMLGLYGLAAALGMVPAAPWSPLGR